MSNLHSSKRPLGQSCFDLRYTQYSTSALFIYSNFQPNSHYIGNLKCLLVETSPKGGAA